ncbi:MAG: type II toxin-antitoxin system prevent-host-death family antitoxin [Pseudomonadales bacterium]|nr:type II toxin-antitoxin system prevent-host-death family antitoxin [Pseudomonadales bacterium]MCP5331043.1 type II toxin-antitoxin system prevent-host-death family antitoxin [Pseudomonadales bacterium]
MKEISVRETRENLSSLLDTVAAGEEVVILRHGKPAAHLIPPRAATIHFTDRADLRASLPACHGSAAALVSKLRDEQRY